MKITKKDIHVPEYDKLLGRTTKPVTVKCSGTMPGGEHEEIEFAGHFTGLCPLCAAQQLLAEKTQEAEDVQKELDDANEEIKTSTKEEHPAKKEFEDYKDEKESEIKSLTETVATHEESLGIQETEIRTLRDRIQELETK